MQEIVEFGAPHGVGLECGSKPELQAVLGLNESTNHLIVCNGYKDEEFMRLALMGQKLGHKVMIVLEQLSELEVLLKVADEMNVKPTAGVRIKLATEGSGRWAKSGGERSKFGLDSVELMKLLDRLDRLDRKDILKLVHFHLGSQITDIRHVKAGLEEIGRYYVELRNMGFDLTHVDVGGGLGVDYEGSRSTRPASVNYSMREYANDVVYTLGSVCRTEELPMPHIISESGRALTAHHSLLLINVIDVESQVEPVAPKLREEPHPLLVEMAENLEGAHPRPGRGGLSRRRVRQGAGPGVLRQRGVLPPGQGRRRAVLPGHAERALQRHGRRQASFPEIVSHIESAAGGPLLLQLLGLPVAAGQLGHRPALSHHADPPAERAAHPAGHAAGRHLRLRRGDRPLHRRPEGQAVARAASGRRRASPTSSASSSPARTRRSWATCTTSSATPTRCTSASPSRATRSPTWSTATP